MAGKCSGEVYEMARLLDLKKAEDIVLIDVSAATIVAETFLVCSGRAGNHIQMLADDLTEKMAALGIQRQRMEGYREGRWIVLDFGEVLVHIFHREERAFYDIERLWKTEDNFEDYVGEPPADPVE